MRATRSKPLRKRLQRATGKRPTSTEENSSSRVVPAGAIDCRASRDRVARGPRTASIGRRRKELPQELPRFGYGRNAPQVELSFGGKDCLRLTISFLLRPTFCVSLVNAPS